MIQNALLIVAAAWLLCAALSYGITFAYFQREYAPIARERYWHNVAFAVGFSIAGPFSLLVAAPLSGWVKHGMQWR